MFVQGGLVIRLKYLDGVLVEDDEVVRSLAGRAAVAVKVSQSLYAVLVQEKRRRLVGTEFILHIVINMLAGHVFIKTLKLCDGYLFPPQRLHKFDISPISRLSVFVY